jgi:hypothetical protein
MLAHANPDRQAPAQKTERLVSDVDGYIVRVWDEVERFMARQSIGPTAFSRAAAGDPNLVRQIREGRRRLTFAMATRLGRFIRERHTASEIGMAAARPLRPSKGPVAGREIRR